MEELVFRFLTQSGYPRAALIDELGLLPVAGGAQQRIPDGDEVPSFAIVDPITGDRLGVVDAVDALDGDGLRARAADVGRYAQRFGGESVQGFLVRIDLNGTTAAEQMQFYRVWPNRSLQRLSAQTFPDLDSLRTRQMLIERARENANPVPAAAADTVDDAAFDLDGLDAAARAGDEPPAARGPGLVAWLPGIALLLVLLLDWQFGGGSGEPALSVSRSLLLVGAAALLVWPSLHRRLR